MRNPLAPFLDRQGAMILDGGLATELEARGEDLADPLWSAKVLLDRPERIGQVHLAYLEAGADCIASASYQATFEGLERRGLSHEAARRVIAGSVQLAREARDGFWSGISAGSRRLRPLVAASVGPYGAFLADGSEYSGDYGLSVDALVDFHRERFDVLASAGADLMACETIPSRQEALALVRLLDDRGDLPAWMSFSCRDGERISDGTPLRQVLEEIEASASLVAVGVNCTAPEHIGSLLRSVRGATSKPLLVYPNSGETWDAVDKLWRSEPASRSLAAAADQWRSDGARIFGGCCRTGPEDIRRLRAALLAPS